MNIKLCTKHNQMTNHNGDSCLKCFAEERIKAVNKFMINNPEIKENEITFRDYRIEWTCNHGVGHTIWAYQNGDIQSDYIHGCDGCCEKIKVMKDEVS